MTAAQLLADPAPQRLTVADLQRRWRCSRATVERRQRDGTLPDPLHLLQRRLWNLADIEAAERKLNEAHAAALSGVAGAAVARRAAARATEARELEQLEAAAAAFLVRRSAGDLARAVQRFAADGKLASIPRHQRAAALKALAGKGTK